MSALYIKPRKLSYEEIKSATGNFRVIVSEDTSEKTCEGNFEHHDPFEPTLNAKEILDIEVSEKEWQKHVNYLGKLRHDHLAQLFGHCYEKKHMILVYRHQRGNLRKMLLHAEEQLSWTERLKIAKGAAQGLKYLLDDGQHSINSQSINTSNILIDYAGKCMLTVHFNPRKKGENEATEVTRYGSILFELLTATVYSEEKMKDSEEKMKDPEDITMDRRLEGQYSEVSSQRAASLVLKCLGCIDSTPTIDSVITELELLQTFDTAYRASRTSNVKHMRSDR